MEIVSNNGALSYKLEVFEGPLDLLLTLISKNKLNIYDIPIAELLEQYMAQIEAMQAADLDVASEFLEMAARLVHIKSVSLLPKYLISGFPPLQLPHQEARRTQSRQGCP